FLLHTACVLNTQTFNQGRNWQNMQKYIPEYIFLLLIGNTAVMAVIYLDHNLRTPKYIAVFNLVLLDLLGSTALLPKVLDMFLFNNYIISYNDSLNLLVLCYDRVVAIMFPLHYQTKVTKRVMFSLIAFSWLFNIISNLFTVGFLTRLSFCESVVIKGFSCDHGQIFKLACNDNFPSLVISFLLPFLILWLPLVIILSSYVCIGYALSKVASVQERAKAFKTCTAHLSLVVIYFIPILITFTVEANIHPNGRIFNINEQRSKFVFIFNCILKISAECFALKAILCS
uniref:G-protein coupled receptors family 1 profile domain-containing protein n=1 Tax=Kryptolebias marmoratus TaxID=37003 RepID=A0A3Q3BFM9_KRYMA